MKQSVDLHTVWKLDDLIRRQATGTCLELAKHLGISRTTLYELISYLKDEMDAPIAYNKDKEMYKYEYIPKFYIGFEIGGTLSEELNFNKKYSANEDDDDFISDDMLEYEEIENMTGGIADEDWHSCSMDDLPDDVILDEDINFNDLYIDE